MRKKVVMMALMCLVALGGNVMVFVSTLCSAFVSQMRCKNTTVF